MQELEKQPIRVINFQGLKIGGENDFLHSKPVFALELYIFDFSVSSHIVKDWYEAKCKEHHCEERGTSDAAIQP